MDQKVVTGHGGLSLCPSDQGLPNSQPLLLCNPVSLVQKWDCSWKVDLLSGVAPRIFQEFWAPKNYSLESRGRECSTWLNVQQRAGEVSRAHQRPDIHCMSLCCEDAFCKCSVFLRDGTFKEASSIIQSVCDWKTPGDARKALWSLQSKYEGQWTESWILHYLKFLVCVWQ